MRTLQILLFLCVLLTSWQAGLAQEDRVRQRGRTEDNTGRPERPTDTNKTPVYGSITGRIIAEGESRGLENAVVVLDGSAKGALTDLRGYFTINKVEPGKKTLKVNYIGFSTESLTIDVQAGETTMIPHIELVPDDFGVEDIEVLAQLAVPQKTPVAVSTVDRVQIQQRGAQ